MLLPDGIRQVMVMLLPRLVQVVLPYVVMLLTAAGVDQARPARESAVKLAVPASRRESIEQTATAYSLSRPGPPRPHPAAPRAPRTPPARPTPCRTQPPRRPKQAPGPPLAPQAKAASPEWAQHAPASAPWRRGVRPWVPCAPPPPLHAGVAVSGPPLQAQAGLEMDGRAAEQGGGGAGRDFQAGGGDPWGAIPWEGGDSPPTASSSSSKPLPPPGCP